MEIEVFLEEHDGDYQGDSFYIFKDGDRFGYLTFGWGSCSGCDALQACDSIQEVTELRDHLFNSIHWCENKEEFARWFVNRDWEGQWEWHSEGWKRFYKMAVEKF